jgi:hypothetical protein
MITPHILKILWAIIHKYKRIIDKGGIFVSLRVEDSDNVNTKQLIQPDLQDLYTSKEMPADYIYA